MREGVEARPRCLQRGLKRWNAANRAITSFTLVGRSCDFTLQTLDQRGTAPQKRKGGLMCVTSSPLIFGDLCQSPTVG